MNHQKCRFMYREIKIVGHIVSPDGVSRDPEKIKAVIEFPIPQTIKDTVDRFFLERRAY